MVSKFTISSKITVSKQNGKNRHHKNDRNLTRHHHHKKHRRHHRRKSNENISFETKSYRDRNRERDYRDKERDRDRNRDRDSNDESKSRNRYKYNYSETLNSTVNVVPSKKSYYQQSQSQKRDYHRGERNRDYYHSTDQAVFVYHKPSHKRKYDNYSYKDNDDFDVIEDRKKSHKKHARHKSSFSLKHSSDKHKKKNLKRNIDIIDETYHENTKKIKTEDVPNKKSKREHDSKKYSKNSPHTSSSSSSTTSSIRSNKSSKSSSSSTSTKSSTSSSSSSSSSTSTIPESDSPHLEKNSIEQLTVENNDYIAVDIDQIKTEIVDNDETPKISTPLLVNSNDNTTSTNVEHEDNLVKYYPSYEGCRSVETFTCLNRIAEGTYGVVYRAKDRKTNEIVALKRLKMENEKEGFPITSLREINTLLKGQHPNIVTVREIVVGSNMDKIFIVMDYVEHDMKSLMETMRRKRQVFLQGEVKCLLNQLLTAIAHLHDNWILHRDLKTSNLLLSHRGILKVGDFGLAREYDSPLKPYTPVVVTLWYRAPELLLGSKLYSTSIDLWSIGCIFAEFLTMNPLFTGKTEIDQINRIFKDLGTPNERIWPGYNKLPAIERMKFIENSKPQLRGRISSVTTDLGFDLLLKFLTYNPRQRITAEDALYHKYFEEQPIAIDTDMFPTWPAKSELGHIKDAALASPRPPSGGNEYKLNTVENDVNQGFRMQPSNSTFLLNHRAVGAGFSLKF